MFIQCILPADIDGFAGTYCSYSLRGCDIPVDAIRIDMLDLLLVIVEFRMGKLRCVVILSAYNNFYFNAAL